MQSLGQRQAIGVARTPPGHHGLQGTVQYSTGGSCTALVSACTPRCCPPSRCKLGPTPLPKRTSVLHLPHVSRRRALIHHNSRGLLIRMLLRGLTERCLSWTWPGSVIPFNDSYRLAYPVPSDCEKGVVRAKSPADCIRAISLCHAFILGLHTDIHRTDPYTWPGHADTEHGACMPGSLAMGQGTRVMSTATTAVSRCAESAPRLVLSLSLSSLVL